MNVAREGLERSLLAHPRVTLACLPTPLQFLPRFSEALGREIWIKRDDLTGLAFGGNKTRKLEFSLGAAHHDGADTVVSVGASQSNHARSVAAAARLLGWDCHLVLGGSRPDRPTGNLLLDVVLGATLHFAESDDWDEFGRQADQLCSDLEAQGKRPVVVPMGGSTPIGALGFVSAYLELLDQCEDAAISPSALVLATSTGGTQAGLEFAHRIVCSGPRVVGAGVAKTATNLQADVELLVDELESVTGLTPGAGMRATVLDGYLGPGYAAPSAGAERAAALLIGTEAILTDPVYSAKGLHALVELASSEPDTGPVVFWHTGGLPAIFSDSVGISTWPGGQSDVGRGHDAR